MRNKNIFLRVLVLALATMMLFTACSPTGTGTGTTTTTGDPDAGKTPTSSSSSTSEPEAPAPGTDTPTVTDLAVAINGSSEYKIIHAESASVAVKTVCSTLSTKIKTAAKVLIDVKPDTNEATETEILVGATNRAESTAATALLEGENWSVTASEKKIVIAGATDSAIAYAVSYFINQYVTGENVIVPKDAEYTHEVDYETLNFNDIKNDIKIYGRTSYIQSGLTVDWSASGVEFTVTCCGDLDLELSSTNNTYFTVEVNGKRLDERTGDRFLAKSGKNTFAILENADYGTYTIRIVKQANVDQANTVFETLRFDGEFEKAPEDKELLIEFIGDSIVCGYGVVDGAANDSQNWGTYKYCDATKAFGYLTANKLDADWRIEGFSGKGLVKGWSDLNVPDVYYKHTYTRNSDLYVFPSARVPDVVVINLGTNDYSKRAELTTAQFEQAVKDFVNNIRAKYGEEMPIVWVYGMMNDGLNQNIKNALNDLSGESNNLFMLSVSKNTSGGNGHPDDSGQEAAATRLAKYIKDVVLG